MPSVAERLALTNIMEIPGVNYAKYLETFSKTGNWLGSIGGVLAYGSLLKMAYDASAAVQNGDPITAQELVRDWCLGTVGAAVLGGMAFAGAAILLAPLAVLGTVGIGAAVVLSIGTSILAAYWGHKAGVGLGEAISEAANNFFINARNVVIRRDPLVLDLDGDGLELSAASGNILFDHNADGIKTGTGWVKPDDGFLVRDLDGNGTIDTGRELFGVDTVKSNGALATQGFDALKDLDSNHDGFITSADAAFAELKVWQDTNQDGISQSGELKTLSQLNITSIGVNGSTTGPQAGQVINNNSVALSATYTRNGVTRTVGAIDLEANNFFTEFPPEVIDEAGNPIPITTQAQALPQMNGSGMVRNLRAAASLSTGLADALQTFAATATHDGQRSQLDSLIMQWAGTTTYTGGLLSGSTANISFTLPAGMTVAQYSNMINVLEAFNGSRFYGNELGGPRPAGFAVTSSVQAGTGATVYHYYVSPSIEQVALLQQAYDALRESVYGALVMQTRLKPYLDSVALAIDETGVHFDTSPAVAMVLNKLGSDAYHAVQDLIELHKYAGETTRTMGWQPYQTLETILETTALPVDAQNLLIAERIVSLGATGVNYGVVNPAGAIVLGNAGANVLTGAGGSDALYGLGGNDTLQAVGNGDTLDGGDGNDVLGIAPTAAAATGTTFIGGAGNDTITGGYFNNTYVFNAGDGQDTVTSYSTQSSGFTDVLSFGAGIAATDVTPLRVGEDLVFKLANSTDQVTVKNWFTSNQNLYQIEQIRFANGSSWTNAQVSERALEVSGTAGNDILTGVNAFADVLHGGAGNDTLQGVGNWDTLDGGDGNDVLGLPTAVSATGTTFIGGAGNDTITGAYYNNTYIFNLGDGQDTVTSYSNQSSGYTDVLKFGAGIVAADVTPLRVGEDLVFKLANGTDQVTVKNWFTSDQNVYQIEQVKFADGTMWTNAQISTRALEVFGTAGNDTLVGVNAFADVLRGGAGNDTLQGVGNWDTLDGGDGNDVLGLPTAVSATGTTFIGGAGNDTITGAYYNNTYIFNLGDGQDTVTSYSNQSSGYTDVLKFGAGIVAADVTPLRVGEDLVFKLAGGADQVTIKSWFNTNQNLYQIEQVKFADGTTWTNLQINTRALEVFGTAGNDTLTGVNAFADVLRGGAGNDTLQAVGNWDTLDGGDGNDVLGLLPVAQSATGTTFIGGAGNDTITGAYYNNTYIFNLGDGQDTVTSYSTQSNGYTDVLKFGAGIVAADVTPLRVGEDLVFKLANGTDQVTVKNWFTSDQNLYQIEQVKFADGTTWTNAQISTRALEVFGTVGNDTLVGVNAFADVLHGGAGNDTLQGVGNWDTLDGGDGNDVLGFLPVAQSATGTTFIGGAGNDTITGGYFNNTYVFNAGDGQDTVTSYSSQVNGYTDVLKFGAGIVAADVTPLRVGEDLVFKLANGTDQVTIKSWFNTNQNLYQIEQVKFADGTTWTNSQISTRALEVFGTTGNDTLTGVNAFADVLHGGAGNDTLQAVGSWDTLDGGDGNDVLGVIAATQTATGTTFIGGTGNDTITGAYYNNTYIFNLGDGQDTVTSYSNQVNGYADVLKFGAGIATGDVTPVRSGVDLVFKLAGGTDQVTVKNWFADGNGLYQVEQVKFADGTTWTNGQINTRALEVFGTAGNDTLVGINAFADVLRGGAGNDTLQAVGNWDVLDGGDGNDVLQVVGGLTAVGTTFVGGTGNDTITGAYYNNTYIFNLGDGQDTISNYSNQASGYADVLKFGAGIVAADVAPVKIGNDLVLKLSNGADQVTVKDWFAGSYNLYQIEQIRFSDGTTWTNAQVNSSLNLVSGTAGVDSLNGLANRYNMMSGLAGNDVLTGANYADRLDGGAGNDTLAGQAGNDTYLLGRGDGADTVQEDDATAGNTDVLQFMSGIASDQLWLQQAGNDLKVSIIGTGDSTTLSNWYLSNQYHVEQFKSGDGKTLLDSQVQNLVDAMAGFSPPTAGETTLSASYQATLQPVLAANWQ